MVYEVELIDEKGSIKPLIRTFELNSKEKITVFDECQKYIYIKPSVKQLFFHNSPDVDGVFSSEDKKKKYKIRLTSKGTGKKIDINFSFIKNTAAEVVGATGTAIDPEDLEKATAKSSTAGAEKALSGGPPSWFD